MPETKTLYDGTEVSMDTPTRIGKYGRIALTVEEIAEREAEEAAYEAEKDARAVIIARQTEYKEKGWVEPFDLIEDILDRGVDVVKADRDAIKAKHPKKEQ